jgi:hypothetical protein
MSQLTDTHIWLQFLENLNKSMGTFQISSFIHSFIHSEIHSFIHSEIHSFIHSEIHSFTHSLTHSPGFFVTFCNMIELGTEPHVLHQFLLLSLHWWIVTYSITVNLQSVMLIPFSTKCGALPPMSSLTLQVVLFPSSLSATTTQFHLIQFSSLHVYIHSTSHSHREEFDWMIEWLNDWMIACLLCREQCMHRVLLCETRIRSD